MSLKNKIDFAVVLGVKHANPNGDPLNGNRPRTNYNGYGEITDVASSARSVTAFRTRAWRFSSSPTIERTMTRRAFGIALTRLSERNLARKRPRVWRARS